MNIGRKLVLGMVSLSFVTIATLTLILTYNANNMARTTEQQIQTMFDTEEESNGKLLTEIGSDFTKLSGSMGDLATQMGRESAIFRGESVGNQVGAIFAMATSTSQTVARLFEGYKADCMQRNIVPDRRFLDSVLNDILEKNPRFQSLWCVFGVNQLDGKDEEFKNSETSGITGQYSPWFHRDKDTGKILHEFCTDSHDDYFMIPYTSGLEHIDGPNNDDGTFIVGLCTPIKVNGETLGVVGVDLRLKTLADMLAGLDLFDTGYAMFISPKGIIAANTHSSAEKGTDIENLNMELISIEDMMTPQRFNDVVMQNQKELDDLRIANNTAALPGATAELETAKELLATLPLYQKWIFGTSNNADVHLLKPVFDKIQKGETAYYGDEDATKRLFPIAGRETLKIHIPIKIGESPIPWTMLIVVEKAKVMETSLAMEDQTTAYLQNLSGKFKERQTDRESDGNNVVNSLQTGMKNSVLWAGIIGLGVLAVAVWFGIVFAGSVNRAIDARDHWYQQVLDVAPSPICVVDPNMNLTFVNEAAEKLLHQDRQDVLEKSWTDVWKTAIKSERTSLINLKNDGTKQTLEEFAHTFWDVFCDRIVDQNGKVTGMVEICKDVTAHEQVVRAAKTIDEIVSQTVQDVTGISNDAAVLSQGAQAQTSYLNDIIAGMSEMHSKTSQNVKNAGSANDLTHEAANAATDGQNRMEKMVSSMHQIGETSKNTKEVIKTIESIAFQTNLLALNAAVEAARAGTHGKGFAVVAEEVRSLAARSAKAAQQTSEMLESSNKQILEGVDIVDQMASSLNLIVERVGQSSELVALIAQSSQEQAVSVDSINHRVEQVNQVAQQNTTAAKETDAATTQLQDNVMQLAQLMRGMSKEK